MEKSPILDPELRIFTINDVKRLYIRIRKKLILSALLGGILAFGFTALSAPKYKIEATFKEGIEQTGGDSALKELLGGVGGGGSQPQAIILMKSFQVLRPLVEKMGLQASVPKKRWLIAKVFKRLRENWKAERKKPLADVDSFAFQDLFYEGEIPLAYTICFHDREHFKVDEMEGTLGVPFQNKDAKFTIVKVPKDLKLHTKYQLQIDPWIPTAKAIRDNLKIASQKMNKSIYDLIFFHRDRHLGAQIVNELMAQYRVYLKEDYNQMAQEQVAYLEKKQEHLYEKMGSVFDEHVAFLSRNIENHGFFGLDSNGNNSSLVAQEKMVDKLLSIDMELKRLAQYREGKEIVTEEGPFSRKLNSLFATILDLKQQRDLLELSLQHQQSFAEGENRLEARRGELKEVRNRRDTILKLLETVDQDEDIPISSFDVNRTLALWAERVQRSQEPEEREDLAEYLENYARLLSVREKMLQERFLFTSDAPAELEGIDLQTARNLFVNYNNNLDHSESQMRHLIQLKKEMKESDFEPGSLSSVLKDPLSLVLIEQANQAALKLKNEKYYSEREGERWQEDLDLQKKILSEHLEQLHAVERLNQELIREKIVGLQQVSLDCINRQISVLHEQITDSIKERQGALSQERQILEEKIREIRKGASELPEKWRQSKWLDMKTKLNIAMIEAITQAVESKTIAHQMHQVESKPLDPAFLPYIPNRPGLFRMAFLGALGFSIMTFLSAVLRAILKGFPTSPDKLRAMQFPFLGEISAFCDGPQVELFTGPDLELIRKIGLFIEEKKGKVISLIEGKGPDYSYALAENLSRISYKSIVVRCDFGSKFREEDLPGLIQIWKGELTQLPIRKASGYDFMTAGGYSSCGVEILQSKHFQQLLEVLKKNYDLVFLLLRSPLEATESTTALRYSDQAVVTVTSELTEQLTPFVNWAYINGQYRLTFIATQT